MNSDKSKNTEQHTLLLNLVEKINSMRRGRYLPLSDLSMHYTWKNMRKSCKTNKFD